MAHLPDAGPQPSLSEKGKAFGDQSSYCTGEETPGGSIDAVPGTSHTVLLSDYLKRGSAAPLSFLEDGARGQTRIISRSLCQSLDNKGEDSPPSPNSERITASRVQREQSGSERPGTQTSGETHPLVQTTTKMASLWRGPGRRNLCAATFCGCMITWDQRYPEVLFPDSPPSSTHTSWTAVGLMRKLNQDGDDLPPIPVVVEEDSRTTAFMEALPEEILVVDRRDLIPLARSQESMFSCVGPVQYRDKVYCLKEASVSKGTREAVRSEHDLYRAMISPNLSVQRRALNAFETSFEILDEARFILHCGTLQGVVRLEGVSIAKHPCRRVTGFLLEYFPRGSLQRVLQSEPSLPYQRKIALALEVAVIVERLHSIGIVHADLNLANLLVADDGSLRVCDFGLAFYGTSPFSARAQVVAGLCRGTPSYMAPELYAGQLCSVESDIFALGVILFEIMEQRGRLLEEYLTDIVQNYKDGNVFYREPPGDGWPEEWRDLVVSCMAVLPEDRPPLSHIIAQLSAWLDREERAH